MTTKLENFQVTGLFLLIIILGFFLSLLMKKQSVLSTSERMEYINEGERRVLKAQELGLPVGDVSTLED